MPLPSDREPQGTFLGMPYDFRKPHRRRFFARVWNPGGPLFSPKTWGVGWTINFAHPWGAPLVGGIVALAIGVAILVECF